MGFGVSSNITNKPLKDFSSFLRYNTLITQAVFILFSVFQRKTEFSITGKSSAWVHSRKWDNHYPSTHFPDCFPVRMLSFLQLNLHWNLNMFKTSLYLLFNFLVQSQGINVNMEQEFLKFRNSESNFNFRYLVSSK